MGTRHTRSNWRLERDPAFGVRAEPLASPGAGVRGERAPPGVPRWRRVRACLHPIARARGGFSCVLRKAHPSGLPRVPDSRQAW